MTYSEFTLEHLRRDFGLVVREAAIFPALGNVEPTPWLKQALGLGHNLAFASEKARSEFIVAPILVSACRELLANRFQIYSGVRLDAKPEVGLKGECDFILGRSGTVLVLQGPLMVILEAKKNDIEEGIGQCAAQMLGAKFYNEQDRMPVPFLYGCVTTGESWQFLKLEGTSLSLHTERLFLGDLGNILWVLVECLNEVDRQAPAAAA